MTKSHSTADCQVKKECNKILAAQQINSSNAVTSGSQSGVSTGQLRHLTEEAFEDALELEIKDESDDVTSNDTNEVDLLYFSRVSNHYLRLVKNDHLKSFRSRHHIVIIDSGANFHMFKDREFSTSLSPASGKVILGDG